jgi:hypothetical protein
MEVRCTVIEIISAKIFFLIIIDFRTYSRPKIIVFYAIFSTLIDDLLSKISANALIMNDDCQTPLDVARVKGHINVVRAIEVYLICTVISS